ncbi:GRB2-associated-binding protein 3 isoform X2 [Xiphias gladius]|uniref:GRB2-associated-binding protein 3 isoform X2 n=1 Tax=Xiphias gladius TaxID=8245 RepID=UPI001A98446D|nr:GRB2-associated-binding protein 3 isoform X2 [Xiphias gladius]
MSTGDVVCTGWLIKSPPEKKLKRFAWRKRWFVLRRGRMSGNPDVLEYYQSKNSKKPIRTIDLKECEVEMMNGQLRIKRDFHGKHLFVVKTSSRIFYLVAKTEEEMNSWISSISQICQFGSLEDAESSEEGFPHTPTSLQLSPDSSDRGSVTSQLDSGRPLDYLFLSQCETGGVSASRHDSFSNSELSLEQKSSDDAVKDIVPSPLCTDSSPSISHASPSPSLFPHGRFTNPPFSAPCISLPLPSSSSSPLYHCATSVFQFDKPYSSASFEATSDRQTPPPLPPKPNHLSEQLSDEGAHKPTAMSARHFSSHNALFPRRTSLSSLDHFRMGDVESRLMRIRRQSLHLPCLNTTQVQSCQGESYVPMTSPSPSVTTFECDGYIPMSPRTFSFLNPNCNVESLMSLSPLTCQSEDLAPPPIHRHLKPRLRRARPPPLDLRGLSTITECPTHLPLSRTMTESWSQGNSSISPLMEQFNPGGENQTLTICPWISIPHPPPLCRNRSPLCLRSTEWITYRWMRRRLRHCKTPKWSGQMSGSQRHKWKIHKFGFKKINNNTSKEDIPVYKEDQKQFKSTLKNSIDIKVQGYILSS